MTEAVPWVKWRFDRWRADEGLRMCGLAARGLWADLLAVMHGCKPYGHLAVNGRAPTSKQIASMVGMTTEKEVVQLLHELEDNGVCSRSDGGLIYCRRMVRDNAAREQGKSNGAMGGNPVLIKTDNHNEQEGVNPIGEIPLKTEKREERREGKREKKESRSLRSLAEPGDEFEAFWSLYPRKTEGPGACLKAWQKARKSDSFGDIVAGLKRYPFKPDFLPMAATWLNQQRWLTEGDTAPATVASPRNGHASEISQLIDELSLDLVTPIEDQFPPEDHQNGHAPASPERRALADETRAADIRRQNARDEAADRALRDDDG